LGIEHVADPEQQGQSEASAGCASPINTAAARRNAIEKRNMKKPP
jgi:hypothetical protein